MVVGNQEAMRMRVFDELVRGTKGKEVWRNALTIVLNVLFRIADHGIKRVCLRIVGLVRARRVQAKMIGLHEIIRDSAGVQPVIFIFKTGERKKVTIRQVRIIDHYIMIGNRHDLIALFPVDLFQLVHGVLAVGIGRVTVKICLVKLSAALEEGLFFICSYPLSD